MGRQFDPRRLRKLLFSSVRAGGNTNGSVWRGEGPGDHCFKVDEIPGTRKRILRVMLYQVDYNQQKQNKRKPKHNRIAYQYEAAA